MAQSDNVVSFNKKPATESLDQQVNAKKIYTRCEELTVNLLGAVMQRMFDSADDTLFKFSEKAQQKTEQASYFDSMRIVRLQRQTITNTFIDQVKANFISAINTKKSSGNDLGKLSLNEMTLVEESDLEESIAVKNMITKIRYQYPEELNALQTRLAHLFPSAGVDDDSNPIGPESICQAFMQAIKTLSIGVNINLIILKLFELDIITGLKPLYDTVNKLLIDANVLPVIRPTFNRSPDQPGYTAASGMPAYPVTGAAAGSMTSSVPGDTHPTTMSADLSISYLHNLMSQYRQTHALPGYGFAAGQAGIPQNTMPLTAEMIARSSNTLTSMLTTLQSSDFLSNAQLGSMPMAIPPGGLREYVISNLQQQGHELQTLNPLDTDIIDIVSMMFEYILDDDRIPDAAKALLSKLQIPLLKAAILDKQLFASKGHPARSLLNEMARATMTITASDVEHADSLLAEIKRIVDTVVTEFNDDLAIFERLLREFQNILELINFQEDEIHQQVAKIIKHKEDSALASKWVDESLKEILSSRQFPAPVEAIITGPWKQVMLTTYLNAGLESDIWKSQVRFIEILDWSIQPKRISMDRAKLASIIYLLVNTLRNGLKNIGTSAEEIVHTLQQLEPYHMASIKGMQHSSQGTRADFSSRPFHDNQENNLSVEEISGAIKQIEHEIAELTAIDEPDEIPAELSDKLIMEDIVLEGYDTHDHDPSKQPQDEYLELARHLEQGKWVEFTGKHNRKVRAKLAFKSELLGEYTFLDWKYKVVADKSLYALAADFRRGTVAVIDDAPLIDRALDAVMNTLSGSGKK